MLAAAHQVGLNGLAGSRSVSGAALWMSCSWMYGAAAAAAERRTGSKAQTVQRSRRMEGVASKGRTGIRAIHSRASTTPRVTLVHRRCTNARTMTCRDEAAAGVHEERT